MFAPFRRSFDRTLPLFATRSSSSRRLQRRAALRRRFLVESLEGRQMLSTLYVTTADDNGSNTNPLTGSLRAAIIAADAAPAGTYSTIDFKIQGSGLQQIALASVLPPITNPVNIDGLSQSGASATSPQIQLDGFSAGTAAFGLDFQPSASGTASNPSQVSGLEITDFNGGGVEVNEASYVNLTDLVVGITELGTSGVLAEGNNVFGVFFAGGSHNTLTGSVVSANQGNGVDIAGSSDDTLSGDFIGTNPSGEYPTDVFNNSLGNAASGVAIYGGSTNNTIGGTATGAGDVISNNDQQGVWISDGGTSDNVVEGDFIGTDKDGVLALPNATGVYIQNDAGANTIGGTTAGARDVIAGNSGDGVHIVSGAGDNVVEGDYIGIGVDDVPGLGNGESGVAIFGGASNNTIGGAATTMGGSLAGAGNVISGNVGNGVYISDGGTNANVIEGDYIGTNVTGTQALANEQGIYLGGGTTNNTIGGTTSSTGDVISGNSTNGIELFSLGTAGNMVWGDDIGVGAGGKTALGNGWSGVAIYGQANNNTVGVTPAGSGAGDVISANGQNGVYISDSGTVGNLVAGDYIGTNAGGSSALANGTGVYIQNNAAYNTIGGTTAAARDVISGNSGDGVHIINGASDNLVEGDYIGVSPSGQTGLGNGFSGVAVFGGATNNTIGGTATTIGGSLAGAGNVISSNGENGVYLSDSGTVGNLVAGDYIGTSAGGSSALPNGTGVYIQNGTAYNTIGGTTAGAGDVISGNNQDGVHIINSASDNLVEGDYIGVSSSGQMSLFNGFSGVAVYAGANNNTIGGTVSGAGDVISGNDEYGVYISDSGTTGNLVAGDDIGTLAGGSSSLHNSIGVIIQNGATDNTIGGTATAARDVISGNNGDGRRHPRQRDDRQPGRGGRYRHQRRRLIGRRQRRRWRVHLLRRQR